MASVPIPRLGRFQIALGHLLVILNCALTPKGQFAYVSNSLNSHDLRFAVDSSGIITALPERFAASLPAGSINLDIAGSRDAKYVYTLNSITGTIGIFAVQPNGV